MTEQWRHLGKAALDVQGIQMRQSKVLQARCVDDGTVGIQSIQKRTGGGVTTRIQKTGDFAHARLGVRDQGIDQCGLAHAGLSHQHAGLTFQQWQQGSDVLLCRHDGERIAGMQQRC